MIARAERTAEGVDLHERLAAEGTLHVKTVLQRQIEMRDREIDRLVYELYGPTEKEGRGVTFVPSDRA